MPNAKRPCDLQIANPVQSTANAASALAAIRSTSKHTWLDTGSQACRNVQGHSRKQAVVRVLRWLPESPSHTFRQQELSVQLSKLAQLERGSLPILHRESLRALFAHLRAVETDPDMINLRM